jgi:hypothetical protein
MAKKKQSKPKPEGQSEAVYTRRGPTNSRTLGSTLNHDHPTIPSSTFRTLDQSVPGDQLRTVEVYKGFNRRTGRSKFANEPVDLLSHAQSSIVSGRFRPVTDGYRQRYLRKESAMLTKSDDLRQTACYPCAPTPLAGIMTGGRGRKDRY